MDTAEKVRLKVNIIDGRRLLPAHSIVPITEIPVNLRKPEYISHDLNGQNSEAFDAVDSRTGEPAVKSMRGPRSK
jgi:hypothetical protein